MCRCRPAAVANEFLTAARAMGLVHEDFAVMFDALAKMSGVSSMTTTANPTVANAPLSTRDYCSACTARWSSIREFEEHANDLYLRALMPGLTHFIRGRRSRGGGHLRGAAARRLHHQHAPRPRALPGQGREAGPHVRRTARQGSGLLPWQGRLDAHRRSRRPAIWAPMPSSAEAPESPQARRSPRRSSATDASASASSARARWAKECSTK